MGKLKQIPTLKNLIDFLLKTNPIFSTKRKFYSKVA